MFTGKTHYFDWAMFKFANSKSHKTYQKTTIKIEKLSSKSHHQPASKQHKKNTSFLWKKIPIFPEGLPNQVSKTCLCMGSIVRACRDDGMNPQLRYDESWSKNHKTYLDHVLSLLWDLWWFNGILWWFNVIL